MKKIIIFILPVILLCCQTATVSDEKKQNLLTESNNIVRSLQTIVNKSSQSNPQVKNVINAMFKKMDNKELYINIDFKIGKNIYDGGNFAIPIGSTDKPHLSISPFLIELYKTQPSIVYSILVHEFTHAYSYFNDKEGFIKDQKNELELYLYEMDASYIEALFIRDYLVPQKMQLTKFENLLLQSNEEDELSTFSIIMRNTDKDLAYAMIGIVTDKQDYNGKLRSIEELGKALLKNVVFDEKMSEWEKYCSFTTLKTYIRLSPEIVFRIAHNEMVRQKKTAIFNMNNYPEIEKARQEMIKRNQPFVDSTFAYYSRMINSFKEI